MACVYGSERITLRYLTPALDRDECSASRYDHSSEAAEILFSSQRKHLPEGWVQQSSGGGHCRCMIKYFKMLGGLRGLFHLFRML